MSEFVVFTGGVTGFMNGFYEVMSEFPFRCDILSFTGDFPLFTRDFFEFTGFFPMLQNQKNARLMPDEFATFTFY